MNHPNVDTKKNDNRLFGGKTVVVTGGARGIGKNICRSFGRSGSKVIICDINEDNGYKTETEFKDENIDVQFYQTDLSKKNAPGQVIRNIIRTHGKIDILVNNARSGPRLDLFEENEETWEQGIAVTLRAAFFCSQEAMRNMIVSGGGSIVNIGSIAAFLYCHESPVYHIAKAGLVQMTRYLASYGGKNRIRVNCVIPGFVVQDENWSRFYADSNRQYRSIAEYCHPLNHIGSSDDIADCVKFLCSEESRFITGQSIIVDGGLTIQEPSELVFRYEGIKHNKEK